MAAEVGWTARSEAHIGRHGISPAEVEQVLRNRPRWAFPGNTEGVTVTFGQTDGGRYLAVMTAEAEDGRWAIVTAREMTDNEKRSFRVKGQRR